MMKHRLILLVAFFSVVFGCGGKDTYDPLEGFVPNGSVRADVMRLVPSERGMELMQRFQEGISQHREWWLAHAASAGPGEQLQYDSRMGLTEAEYEEMNEHMDAMRFRKVGTTNIEFTRDGGMRTTIKCKDLDGVLDGIQVNYEHGFVETPYGRLTDNSKVKVEDPDSPTGPWWGSRWKLEEHHGAGPYGTIVKFGLGLRLSEPKGVLFYSVRKILPDAEPEKIDVLLFYEREIGQGLG